MDCQHRYVNLCRLSLKLNTVPFGATAPLLKLHLHDMDSPYRSDVSATGRSLPHLHRQSQRPPPEAYGVVLEITVQNPNRLPALTIRPMLRPLWSKSIIPPHILVNPARVLDCGLLHVVHLIPSLPWLLPGAFSDLCCYTCDNTAPYASDRRKRCSCPRTDGHACTTLCAATS